jgi:hypothetical protein
MQFISTHFQILPNLSICLACLHGCVIGPSSDAIRSIIECESCWNHVTKPCNRVWKVEVENIQMVFQLTPMRKSFILWPNEMILDFLETWEQGDQLSYWALFIWSLDHDKFWGESLGIKHIWKFSKYQVKCSLLPPWITFAMEFKWKKFLIKVISL